MQDLFLNFVEKIGKRKEFKMFLDLYTKIPRMQFALIKISGATLDKHMDQIAKDIAFLNKLGIYPILLHGAGAELDRQLPHSKKVDGIRVTEKEDMAVVKAVFDKISANLVEKITLYGGAAAKVPVPFECERLSRYGYVGQIQSVDTRKIEAVIYQDKTPVISPLGLCAEGILNVNADTAAKAVVQSVQPQKIIILTETGGILDESGHIISFFNPGNTEDWINLSGGMLLKIKEITELLENNPESAVAIASAENLLKEIFTVKGSGTYIKSYDIAGTKNLEDIDKEKLKQLIEDAFDKSLVTDYFENQFLEVIYEKNYEGAAVIRELNHIPYLDKFAVAKHRQETGLGACIWEELRKRYDKIAWRVRAKNPLNQFYAKQCTGCMKYAEWNVYWINLPEEEIFPTVKLILDLDKTVV